MDTPQPEKPRKSYKLLLIAGGLVLLIAAGIVGLIFFYPRSQDGSLDLGRIRGLFSAGEKSKKEGQRHLYKMDPFLVNLVDPGQLRYLKISIHVESDQEKLNEEYEKRLPQLRDAVLTLLSSKNYKEIMSSEGKKLLREEIKEKMNQTLADFKVRNVYFTEFVIQ